VSTEAVVARIDETVKEYGRQFDTLMVMLKEQVRASFNVLYILCREHSER
jgi:phytoene/squalene synthetase